MASTVPFAVVDGAPRRGDDRLARPLRLRPALQILRGDGLQSRKAAPLARRNRTKKAAMHTARRRRTTGPVRTNRIPPRLDVYWTTPSPPGNSAVCVCASSGVSGRLTTRMASSVGRCMPICRASCSMRSGIFQHREGQLQIVAARVQFDKFRFPARRVPWSGRKCPPACRCGQTGRQRARLPIRASPRGPCARARVNSLLRVFVFIFYSLSFRLRTWSGP